MSGARSRERTELGAASIGAAVLGAPLASAAVCAALACALPLPGTWAAGLSYHLLLPLWVALASLLPLARSGARAWAICGALTLPALGILVVRALA